MAKAWHGRFKTEPPGGKLLSIRLLGPSGVSIEGRPLRFGIKKALALLCYLAVEGGRRSRRELTELLWQKSDEQHARTDLRSALARLRKTLGDIAHDKEVSFLLVDGGFLGLELREIENIMQNAVPVGGPAPECM